LEGSCECIEYAVGDSLQGVFPRLGLGVGLTTPHCKKINLLRHISKRLGPRLILWHDLSNVIDGANWIQLAKDSQVAGFCVHGDDPTGSKKKAGYCLTSRVTISFSKKSCAMGLIYSPHILLVKRTEIWKNIGKRVCNYLRLKKMVIKVKVKVVLVKLNTTQ
jgi:hypothetical protein